MSFRTDLRLRFFIRFILALSFCHSLLSYGLQREGPRE